MPRTILTPLRTLATLALLATSAGISMVAQVAGSTMSGTITDMAGAVIPAAHVSVQNKDTGVTRELETNHDGLYVVPNLTAGDYVITVSAPTFETMTAKITLTVGAEQRADLRMHPGSVTTSVSVTDQQVSIDLNTSSINSVVSGQQVRELPLNGRSWTDLVTLQPGVNIPTNLAPITSDERGDRGFGSEVSINGARPQQNNYRLDGVSINDNANGGPGSVLGGQLGVDAIQEFSVLTTNYSAEYGRTSGGVINAITRSGTNAFHGSAYEFLRNQAVDSENYFDLGKKPPFSRNQFGASGGAPLVKERFFAFADYEGIRQTKGVSSSANVPSTAARAGNLCSKPDGSCTPTTVTVDPSAQKYLPLFPLPNNGTSGSGGDVGLFVFAGNQTVNENFFTTRSDAKISGKDSIFATYVYDRGQLGFPDTLAVVQYGSVTDHQIAVLEETHTFLPSFVNSVRIGYNRAVTDSFGGLNALNPAAKDASLAAVPGQNAAQVNISGIEHMQGGVAPNKNYIWNSFQAYDDAFYTAGNHSFKFGFAAEHMQLSALLTTAPTGSFFFGSLLNFLTNRPDIFQADFPTSAEPRHLRQSLFGGYVQDDWRAERNLTLNIGLRYEMSTVPTEANNKLATLINLTDAQPHLGNPFFLNPTTRNFEPRFGLAWDPFKGSKTAVRAGFGIYDVLPLPYQTEFLTRGAPYFKTGTATNLPQGSFYAGAFPSLGTDSLREAFVERKAKRNYVMQWNMNIQQELSRDISVLVAYVGSRGVHQPFRADDVNAVLPCNLQNQPGCPPPALLGNRLFWPSPLGSGAKLNNQFGQISGVRWGGDSYFHALEIQSNMDVANRRIHFQTSYTWGKSIDTSSSSLIGDAFETAISSPYWWNTRLERALSDFDIRKNLTINAIWKAPDAKSWGRSASLLANGWELSTIFKASDGVPFTPTFGTDGDPLGSQSSDPFDFPDKLNGPGCKSTTNPGNPGHYIKTNCFAVPTASSALYPYCDNSAGGLNPPAPQCFNLMGNAKRNSINAPGYQDVDFSAVKNNRWKRFGEDFNIQFRAEVFNILNHPNFAANKHNDIFDSGGAPVQSAGVLGQTVYGNERQVQFAAKVVW